MHIGIMEPTKRSFDGFSRQKIEDSQAIAEVAGRQSNYMTNMILPDMVQSSKSFPLGPDCVITRDEVPDQSVLLDMDLYWLISLEKGCVECKVMVGESAKGKLAVTQDPKVIITRKPRRFEAYSCAVCRQNFVTVVQALLHMKAFHRKGKKILIQDQNVFHDIEKAMEVPPVPLPWYVSKRATEPLPITTRPFTVIPNTMQTTSTASVTTVSHLDETVGQDVNPVALLLQAVVKEYNKPVNMVLFGKDVRDITIKFEDQTSLLAHLFDLTNQERHDKSDPTEKLEFKIQRLKAESDEQESCMIHANNPELAQKLLHVAIQRGITQRSGSAVRDQITGENIVKGVELIEKSDKYGDHQATQIKLDSRGRPSKTVRFMLGSPDSDEDANSSASERIGGRDSTSPLASLSESQATSENIATPVTSSDDKNPKDDEGLKGVVNQLISTASKGIISPVSPIPLSITSGIQEEVITNAAFHARFMPKNHSVPNLPSISIIGTSGPISSAATSSAMVSSGLTRVQSWGGSDPNSKLSMSTYAPHVPMNIARDGLRRAFTAGRSFTYAEKIKLMNKLNDEDALITQEHVKGAGKLMGAESSRGHIPSVASMPTIQQSVLLGKPLSPTMVSSSSKMKKSESDIGPKLFFSSDVRRKRRSKYDVDQFVDIDSQRYPRDSLRSSSEGSVSDKEDIEESPPTLLGLLRNRAGMLAGQPISITAPSVISDTDYYGSGEWASAAMQTLKNLQSVANAMKVSDLGSIKTEDSGKGTPAERISLPVAKALTSTDNSSPGVSSPFVPVTGPSGSAMDTIVALAKQVSSEEAYLKHMVPDTSSSSQIKRPGSPLTSEAGNVTVSVSAKSSSSSMNDPPLKRKKKDKPTSSQSARSDLNNNLKKPIVTNATQRPHIIAEKGDGLVFTERVTDASLQDSNKMILKFSQSTHSDNTESAEHGLDMPGIFANSVDTFMKVRYIEKIAKCKVCGFSTPVDTVSDTEVLKSHVMEHSLKEIIQAGASSKELL